MMNVLDDEQLAEICDRKVKLQLDQIADDKLANELPAKQGTSGREAAKEAFVAGRDPGTITAAPIVEQLRQCNERRAARPAAIEELDCQIEAMKPAARKRVRQANKVDTVNNALATAINRLAEPFGAICSLRDMFAADWQAADLLGSGFLSYGFALHPGLTTDPTSRLNLWRKDAAGIDLNKQDISIPELIDMQRTKLQIEEDEVKVAVAEARGREPGASREQVLANHAQRKLRIAADRRNLDAIEKALK